MPASRRKPAEQNIAIYDAPGAGTQPGQGTFGYAINDAGYITGAYVDSADKSHGFVRAPDGSFTVFDAGHHPTNGYWINNKGAVVGQYVKQDVPYGLVRTPAGKIRRFDAAGGNGINFANYINLHGVVAGDTQDANGIEHAFLRAKNGMLTSFDEPNAGTGAGQGTDAFAINDEGIATGPYVDSNGIQHGYVRASNGGFTEVDVPGEENTSPSVIDADGWIDGYSFDNADGVAHGFLRKPDGTYVTFDASDAGTGPGQGTGPLDLSDDHAATGIYIDANDVLHSFLRLKNGRLREFDAPGAGVSPGTGTYGFSVNLSHQVSGFSIDDNGVSHGFIRTP